MQGGMAGGPASTSCTIPRTRIQGGCNAKGLAISPTLLRGSISGGLRCRTRGTACGFPCDARRDTPGLTVDDRRHGSGGTWDGVPHCAGWQVGRVGKAPARRGQGRDGFESRSQQSHREAGDSAHTRAESRYEPQVVARRAADRLPERPTLAQAGREGTDRRGRTGGSDDATLASQCAGR
jgi:hypothetical protein